MLAFGMVTLFLMMLLYALQCFVLDYFLVSKFHILNQVLFIFLFFHFFFLSLSLLVYFSLFCYVFVVVDGLILIYMLLSYNVDYAGMTIIILINDNMLIIISLFSHTGRCPMDFLLLVSPWKTRYLLLVHFWL